MNETDAAYNADDETLVPLPAACHVQVTIEHLNWTAEARDALKALARRKGECGEALRAQVDASAHLNRQFGDLAEDTAQELDQLAFALANLMGDTGALINPQSLQRLQTLGFVKITVSR
jgi:hypothetical protein